MHDVMPPHKRVIQRQRLDIEDIRSQRQFIACLINDLDQI